MIRLASVVAVALVAVTVFLVNPIQGQNAKKIALGESATFTDLPGVDGKKHSMSEYKKDVLVVIITCNHCPVAIQYEDRMIAFTKKFGDKADVVAINVNNTENDKLDKMIERSKEKGFNFPYLYDESQTIARVLGATVTPHFFVFNKERKLVYRGAMDDNNNPSAAKVSYLEAAVTGTIANQTLTTTETKARGCGVRYQ